MRLSQQDLAEALGVSRAALSQATSRGHKCQGFPVRGWAVYDGGGRVAGYDVPPEAASAIFKREEYHGRDEGRLVRANPEAGPQALAGIDSELSQMLMAGGSRSYTSLLPEGQDYFRPVGAGGAAHVLATAVREDNATAHGALMVGGAAIGGLIGSNTTDPKWIGALGGALLGMGAVAMGMLIQTAENPSQEQEIPDSASPGGSEMRRIV